MACHTDRASRRSAKDAARRTTAKPCALCSDKVEWVDYKDVPMLRRYMSDRGKIRARRVTGNCTQHQSAIAMAIKTARELVLLPYAQRTVTERSGGRGPGRARAERSGVPASTATRPTADVDARPDTADVNEELSEPVDVPAEMLRSTEMVAATQGGR